MSLPPRPEFEPPAADEPPPRRRGGPLLAWLRLMRLPNVFTAISDVLMGYAFVHGELRGGGQLACLVAASALLYTAGMVLNDVFDFEIDAQERPFRPLPSGQIGRGTARTFGFMLLLAGVALGWIAGYLPGLAAAGIPWRSGLIATLLAGAVLLYDGWLKLTPYGPLGMGLCRFLNVLLGMSTAGGLVAAYGTAELLAAAGIGIYIVGVTWLARSEAGESQGGVLIAAMIVMSAGIVILGSSAAFRVLLRPLAIPNTNYYWILLGLLMVTVLRRCSAAALDPQPEKVQAAVKHSILSLIWFDAATAAATAGPLPALIIALLLIPALVLGRWVYST